MSRFDLTGSVAVVTGGAGKLGPVWSSALLDAGASVLSLDLPGATGSPAFGALAELTAGSGRFATAEADVLDRASLEDALATCRERFGVPVVLVNNAGIDQPPGVTVTQRIEDWPLDDVRDVLDVNVAGTFAVTQVFGGAMVQEGRGSIINIGSLYASVSPDPRLYDHIEANPPFLKPPAYTASKAAVVSLTRYLAAHWGPYGVRVNALSPGGVLGGQDPQFQAKFNAKVPLGRMAGDADLAGPLVFLASEASSYVTGTELRVDGGFTAW